MQNNGQAKEIFNQKLDKLRKGANPSHIGQNLKEIVIYKKLLEIQEQMTNLEKILTKN